MNSIVKRLYLTELATLFYVTSVITISYNQKYYHISNILGIILILSYVLESVIKKYFFLEIFTPAHFLFLLFIVYNSVTLMFNPEGYDRFETIIQILVLATIITNVIGSSGKMWPIVYGIFIGLGYAIFKVHTEFSADQYMQSSDRVGGALSNPNTYATALLVGAILSFYNIICIKNSNLMKFVNYLLILIFGYQIIIYTGSRKGVILFCFLLIIIFIYSIRSYGYHKKIIFTLLGLVQIYILTSFIRSSSHYDRIENIYLYIIGESIKERSLQTRTSMFSNALDLWSQKPLFGWGIDQFRYVGEFGVYSHSNISEILVNNGLFGFLVYYGIYGYIFFKAFIFIKSEDVYLKKLGIWFLFAITALLIQDFALVSYYSKIYWILISAMLGILHFHSSKKYLLRG